MLQRIKKILKNNWPILFLFFISAIIYHDWLSFKIFIGGDYGFRYGETVKDFMNYSIWLNNTELGNTNITLNMIFFSFFPGLFGFFGIDSNIFDKFLLFWPFIFVTPLASFLLARKILKNNVASIISALVYCFNTYFLAINSHGHFSLALAATFAPLALLFFIEALEKESINYSLLTTVFLFIVGSYDFRVFYIEIFIIIGYFIFYLLNYQRFEKKSTLERTKIFLIMVVSIMLLNVYWMLPLAKTGSLIENAATSRDLIPFSLNIQRTFTLFHPFWTGSAPKWFDGQDIPIYFWLIPIFAFAGLWLNRKNKKILFFGFVALAGIFLAKQETGPFGDLYTWLFKKFPGFNAFREASKFYFAIALSYSILIGSFVASLWQRVDSYKFRKFSLDPSAPLGMTMKYFLTISIAILFLWNTRSIITGKMENIFISKKIPTPSLQIKDFVLEKNDYFKSLLIPVGPEFFIYTAKNPIASATLLQGNAWKRLSKNFSQAENIKTNEKILYTLNQTFSQNLLNDSSIRYVIIDRRMNKDLFNQEIKKVPYLEEIELKIKDYSIFENKSYKPHIYLTEKTETIHRNISFKKVAFKTISPSQYEIFIKNLSGSTYLNFSDKFHPDWKLRAGNFNWFSAIFSNNYFLPDKNHFESDARLNSFFLDPENICESRFFDSARDDMTCIKNADGTFDLNLTLYFKPQSYLYLGLVFLAMTFLIIISYFAKSLINKIKK